MAAVHRKNALTKFFVSGLILFALALSYRIVGDVKHVLILSSEGGGNFVMSHSFQVKLAFVALFLLIYRKSNLPQLLFAITASLLAFFVFFHLWGFQHLPEQVHSYYYLLADLFTIGLLFWAFANQIFTVQEAKLSYPLLSIFPVLGILIGSQLISRTSPENMMTPLGFVLLGALALFIVGAWLMKRNKFTELPPVSAKTPHTSHSFQFGYLLLIFVMATSLGFCDHLITLLLKTLLKQHVTSSGGYDSLAYAQLMGQYSMYTGAASAFLFLLTFWMIWAFGWLKSALISPLYVLLSTAFLLSYLYSPAIQGMVHTPSWADNLSPIFLFIVFQSMALKGLAMLFFATKEMAYIPLGVTTKVRGKVIVDVLCAGAGISLGNLCALFILGPVAQSIELIFSIILGVSLIWILSVVRLGKMFKSISR